MPHLPDSALTNKPYSHNSPNKRLRGQYFTITNPFDTVAFYRWIDEMPNEKKQEIILEPFAGAIIQFYMWLGQLVLFPLSETLLHNKSFPHYLHQAINSNHQFDWYDSIQQNCL